MKTLIVVLLFTIIGCEERPPVNYRESIERLSVGSVFDLPVTRDYTWDYGGAKITEQTSEITKYCIFPGHNDPPTYVTTKNGIIVAIWRKW